MILYIVQDSSENIKVGITTNLAARLSSMQTNNAETLSVICYVKSSTSKIKELEKEIHKYISEYNVRGEWFRQDALLYVLKLLKEHSLLQKIRSDLNNKEEDSE